MKPKTPMFVLGPALGLLLAVQLACSITPGPAGATSGPPPDGTESPTLTPIPPAATAVPLHEQVVLQSVPYHDEGDDPRYELDAVYPVLVGSDDPRLTTFNNQMDVVVVEEIGIFREMLVGVPDDPLMGGSFYEQDFELLSPWGGLFSLRFRIMTYMSGAAHPGTRYRTATYDLEYGADVSLDQLFLPGADYLGALADFCKAELAARDIAFDTQITGADPTADNYRNWNVTPGGLLITFDEYQVAAYAAGPQEVLIPYADLAAVIDPAGPLASLLP